MSGQQPPGDRDTRVPGAVADDTEMFPGNWVRIIGDYSTDGVWSAAGLFCAASDLPIPSGLQKELEAWGFNYVSRVHAGARFSEAHGQWFDTTGFDLARRVSEALPHWTVEFASEFGVYKTPSGERSGIVTSDGNFLDLTEAQEALLQRLIDEEYDC